MANDYLRGPHYNEHDLEYYERLVDQLRNQADRQHILVYRLTGSSAQRLARSVLDDMTKTLDLFERQRALILKAVTE